MYDLAVTELEDGSGLLLHQAACPAARAAARAGKPVMTMFDCERLPTDMAWHDCLSGGMSEQLPLFEDEAFQELRRAVDDEREYMRNQAGKWQREGQSLTSRVAAHEVMPVTGKKRLAVYNHLVAKGERGATDEEMQYEIPMIASTQRPRRVELVDEGRVVDSGQRRKTSSGQLAVVWVTVEWRR